MNGYGISLTLLVCVVLCVCVHAILYVAGVKTAPEVNYAIGGLVGLVALALCKGGRR